MIYCFNKDKYNYLKQNYSKLEGIYDDFELLTGALVKIPAIKNIKIKSSNLFFFEEYNDLYIKIHYEIIRKYSLYKLLKSQNFNENNFLNIVKNKYPYYFEMSKQLIYNDENEMIKLFKDYTEESEETIRNVINCNHNIQNYINIYTNENFYYKYLNKFLREGDFDKFKILSNHISKFIYHLYEYRKNNNQNHDNSILFRNMYISEEEFDIYKDSIDKVICYPSFTSTSLNENFEPVEKTNELFVKLIIEQNNSKSVVSISNISINQEEKEYLFLPFSFFKIIKIKEGKGTLNEPHIIYLIALNSEKPIEDIILDFMEKETDNLDLEGLDMLQLYSLDTKIGINPNLLMSNYAPNGINI
jgi:hypothetical protein